MIKRPDILDDSQEPKRRNYALTIGLETRSDGKPAAIRGYSALFNSESEDLGFIETIRPGAFTKALKKSDVRGLFNHDPNYIFARTGKNLTLRQDKKGLEMVAEPLPTSTWRMVAENIQHGLVTGQSFAFTVRSDEWDSDYTRRTITEVDELFDVGPVVYPAYTATDVSVRKNQANYAGMAAALIEELVKRGIVKADPMIDGGGPQGDPMITGKELFERLTTTLERLKK